MRDKSESEGGKDRRELVSVRVRERTREGGRSVGPWISSAPGGLGDAARDST